MIVSHIYYCEITSLKKRSQFFSCVWRCCATSAEDPSHPSQWDPTSQNCWIQISSSKWLEPCGKVWWCTWETVTTWWVLGFQSIWKNYAKRHRQIGSSPHKGWKKSLKAEPRRTFITFLLPNSPTGPTFFVFYFLKRQFFPKKTLAWIVTQLFYFSLLGYERELFKKEKWRATRTVWSDFCLSTTFLVTIKRTS